MALLVLEKQIAVVENSCISDTFRHNLQIINFLFTKRNLWSLEIFENKLKKAKCLEANKNGFVKSHTKCHSYIFFKI